MSIFPTPNTITTDRDDFYVSYNDRDIKVYGSDTTALVWGEMQGFYILNGNHVKAYRELESQGWDACYAYYLSKPELHNKYSDKQFPPLTVTELLARRS